MADAALDNDVILKGASYGFLTDLLSFLPDGPHVHGVLGAAKYMLPKKLTKKPVGRQAAAMADLIAALSAFEALEPDGDERQLAASLQFNAQQASVALDAGEAQLVAMVVTRELKHLLTGDKRAITALASTTLPVGIQRQALAYKLICFEQALWLLLDSQDPVAVRAAICAEPGVDTQMRICFSCFSPQVTEDSWREGLHSAIEQVRAQCPDLLATI